MAIEDGGRGWTVDPRVDDYLDAMPAWQRTLAHRVREIVHDADPAVVETIKRRVQPYFVLDGNIAALLTTKDHLNVFLYDGGLAADPAGIITHGHQNSTARQISLYPGDRLDEEALRALFVDIIAINRAGGWRRLKADRPR